LETIPAIKADLPWNRPPGTFPGLPLYALCSRKVLL